MTEEPDNANGAEDPMGRMRRFIPDDQVYEMRKLRSEGLTQEQIAEKPQISLRQL